MKTPIAKRVPHALTQHGDVREDEYYWLRNRNDSEVIAYLEEENRYYEAHMEPLKPLTDHLFNEMVKRVPDAEMNVPVQSGAYYYYTRMEKDLQYPIYARKSARTRGEIDQATEEILLDLNTLVDEDGYLSVTVQRMNPAQTRLAYLENRDGTDRYTLFVKDLETGERLSDTKGDIFIESSLEWDATGDYLFYVTVDDTQRPYQAWRHKIGTDARADVLLYEETDTTYTLSIDKSRSGRYLFLISENKTTTEVRFLDAERPEDSFTLFDARQPGVEYTLEHWGDDFIVLTNHQAKNFRVLTCKTNEFSQTARTELFPYDESRFLRSVYPFKNALLFGGRENGRMEIWVYQHGQLAPILFDEPVYSAYLGNNRSYETDEVLIQFQSLVTPKTTYGYSLETGVQTVLQVDPVPGTFDKSLYHQTRIWATAEDGVQVPVLVVYREGALERGPAPLLLNGYGSYGMSSDPYFSPQRLPLLDMGVVLAIAQIRGGSEMGYHWYEDGKMLKKRNTFTDFIAAAKTLIAEGYTTSSQMAAIGRSAGGLLVGAVANMAGNLFQVIIPGVPFVDVVTTMLDETIPLTTLEWDEWGNPADEEYYHYMKSYSPYDNVEPKAYPHMLVSTGLNDPRVSYWEPAKWVARLRAVKTDENVLLLKTNMGAGHFGASGRFGHMREVAEEYAFILDKLGVQLA